MASVIVDSIPLHPKKCLKKKPVYTAAHVSRNKVNYFTWLYCNTASYILSRHISTAWDICGIKKLHATVRDAFQTAMAQELQEMPFQKKQEGEK
jgi:hypothetical protein